MALFGTVGLFGLNMGFLGVHGGGHADRGRDECSLFGHEAPEESEQRGSSAPDAAIKAPKHSLLLKLPGTTQ